MKAILNFAVFAALMVTTYGQTCDMELLGTCIQSAVTRWPMYENVITQSTRFQLPNVTSEELRTLCNITTDLGECVGNSLAGCSREEALSFELIMSSVNFVCNTKDEFFENNMCLSEPSLINDTTSCLNINEFSISETMLDSSKTLEVCSLLDTALSCITSSTDAYCGSRSSDYMIAYVMTLTGPVQDLLGCHAQQTLTGIFDNTETVTATATESTDTLPTDVPTATMSPFNVSAEPDIINAHNSTPESTDPEPEFVPTTTPVVSGTTFAETTTTAIEPDVVPTISIAMETSAESTTRSNTEATATTSTMEPTTTSTMEPTTTSTMEPTTTSTMEPTTNSTMEPTTTSTMEPTTTSTMEPTTTSTMEPTTTSTMEPTTTSTMEPTTTSTMEPTTTSTMEPTTSSTMEPTTTSTMEPTTTSTMEPTTTSTMEPTTTSTMKPTTTSTSEPTTISTMEPTSTSTMEPTTTSTMEPTTTSTMEPTTTSTMEPTTTSTMEPTTTPTMEPTTTSTMEPTTTSTMEPTTTSTMEPTTTSTMEPTTTSTMEPTTTSTMEPTTTSTMEPTTTSTMEPTTTSTMKPTTTSTMEPTSTSTMEPTTTSTMEPTTTSTMEPTTTSTMEPTTTSTMEPTTTSTMEPTTTSTMEPTTTSTMEPTTTSTMEPTTTSTMEPTTTSTMDPITSVTEGIHIDPEMNCDEEVIAECIVNSIGSSPYYSQMVEASTTGVFPQLSATDLEELCKSVGKLDCLEEETRGCTGAHLLQYTSLRHTFNYVCGAGKQAFLQAAECFAEPNVVLSTQTCLTEPSYEIGSLVSVIASNPELFMESDRLCSLLETTSYCFVNAASNYCSREQAVSVVNYISNVMEPTRKFFVCLLDEITLPSVNNTAEWTTESASTTEKTTSAEATTIDHIIITAEDSTVGQSTTETAPTTTEQQVTTESATATDHSTTEGQITTDQTFEQTTTPEQLTTTEDITTTEQAATTTLDSTSEETTTLSPIITAKTTTTSLPVDEPKKCFNCRYHGHFHFKSDSIADKVNEYCMANGLKGFCPIDTCVCGDDQTFVAECEVRGVYRSVVGYKEWCELMCNQGNCQSYPCDCHMVLFRRSDNQLA